MNLKSYDEWRAFTKTADCPVDIPVPPNRTYKDKGWAGMGDWLGTGNIASQLRVYRPFKEARAFARSLNLKSGGEWRTLTQSGKLPEDIPAKPDNTYKEKGWAGMGDWLGIAPHLRVYRPFNKARAFVRVYRPFKKARAFVRSLNLKNQGEWRAFTKTADFPADIPVGPNQTYKDKGWTGYGDWLGTGNIAPASRVFLPFEEARAFARSLNLKSQSEWHAFAKSGELPADVPSNPNQAYKEKGWAGMGDWLGTA